MSKRLTLILAVVLAPVLVACAPEPPPVLVIGLANGPVSLDPHTQDEVVTFSILSNMYEGLVGFDPHLKVVPVLADGYNNPD
ncbi:MAG TPA: ABC transporter substrate-binding protein, partial [Acidobacteriota bacterium]|nr:ABC transporter substrate-binding protein [Acidobacteriota bacterium]